MESEKSLYTSDLGPEALRQNAFLQKDTETLLRLAEEAKRFIFNSSRAGDIEGIKRWSGYAAGCEGDIEVLLKGEF